MKTRGPTFLGIGAQKAGTTWLHSMLSLHPDIGMPEQKELHFWDREVPDNASIQGYLAGFDHLAGDARGEITPSYAILPAERVDLIHAALPRLQLIYVLRNPIDRAWSQARMELARAVHHGLELDATGRDAWLIDQVASSGSLARGNYPACIRNWSRRFAPDQLRVWIYDDVVAAPRAFLEACAMHLGVDPSFYAGLPQSVLGQQVLPEQRILNVPRLDAPQTPPSDIARRLVDIYAPVVRELGPMLGRDLSGLWLAAYQTVPD
ncbi:MAG TPA: sulfotransferase [Gammaproteobacteria bacterium]|jgi:hypothetical protein|nr:sulfotransferase [Gammaproteobacteria bacterium]